MIKPDLIHGETRLFRPEAVSSAGDRLGNPVHVSGLASWMLTAFLTTLLLVAVIFLCVARYARKETVIGSLQPAAGALRVTSVQPGVVAAVYVREGQDVVRGQRLVALSMDPTVAGGRKLGTILSEASTEQAVALDRQAAARRTMIARQRDEIKARKEALGEQRARLGSDAKLQQARVELAEQTAEAARTLWGQQLMSAVQYRQREEALIVARQGLSAIEREQSTIPSALAQLVAQDQRLVADLEDTSAGIAASSAVLTEKKASNQAGTNIVLTANETGQVAALQARPGAATTAGQTLAIVLPRGVQLQAELWLPSRAAGFVRPGNRVRLMYDAFPYQRFGVGHGLIAEVARAPTAPGELPIPMRAEESLYRVLVNLDQQGVQGYGQIWHLAPGMRLTADIVLEQQSLIEWLFDKVRAARVRATPL